MTRNDTRKKARAVFLSFVMVVSMFGAPMAFAGSAAADTTDIGVSDTLVQGDFDISVDGTVNENGTVHAFIDENGDGQYHSANDSVTNSVSVDNWEEDNEFSISLNGNLESGTYDVYVVQTETLSDGTEGTLSTTLQVDADDPTFGNETPEDGSSVNPENANEIVVPVNGTTTDVAHLTTTVLNGDGDVTTWDIDPETADADGVNWNGSALIIEPGVGEVPELVEGDTTVSVEAEDEAGNTNSTEFTFNVDSTGPTFDLTSDIVPEDGDVLTNGENVSTTIGVNGGDYAIDNSSVSLTVVDADGNTVASYDNEDTSVYNNETQEFVVDPLANDNVSSYDDGTYTFIVSATNEIGNSNSATFGTFTVDTTSPEVTDVSLTDDAINSDDKTANDVQVVVSFAEDDVDPSSVSATVSVDGNSETLTSFTAGDDGSVVSDDLSLDDDTVYADGIENDSAVVNVTAAQDDAENQLANPNDTASNTTFAIDTLDPKVTIATGGEGNLPNPISGYVNITGDVTVEDADGNEPVYVVQPDSDADEIVIENPENLNTENIPEGEHTLEVRAEDDSGNTDSDSRDFTVDNFDPSIEYVGDEAISGDVNVEDAFDISNAGTATVEYSWEANLDDDDTFEVTGEDSSFNVNDVGEGEYRLTATVKEHDGDVSETVIVVGSSLNIEDEDVTLESEDGELLLTIDSELELDSLVVTAETADDYVSQDDRTYELDDFEQDGSVYTLTDDKIPRDGVYAVTVKSAESGDQVYDGGAGDSTIVDAEAPSLIDADIVGMDKGQSQVELTFSEPLDATFGPGNLSFADDRAADIGGVIDSGAGTAVITFDREIQTGDDPEITIEAGSYTDVNGTANDADAEVVDSAELDLSEGANFVSVPIEAGTVSLDEVDTSNIDAIWSYDGGEWHSYDPDADENDFDELHAGQGYVVYADSDTEVDVRGYTVIASSTDDGPTAPGVEHIEAGWNLVGHFQEGSQSTDRALTTVDQVAEVGVLGQANQYAVQTVDTMEPGEAYWVFVESNDQYVRTTYEDADQSAAPQVSGTTVTDNDDDIVTTGDTVDVSATVTDDNLAMVYVDASPLGGPEQLELTSDGGDTYTASFEVGSEGSVTSDGDVSLTVIAFDEDGITSFGEDSVELDTQVDQASIDTTDTENGDLNVTISDANGISSAEVWINGSDGNTVQSYSLGNGLSEGENTIDISGLADDNYDVNLKATDTVGNDATDTGSFSLTTSGDLFVSGGNLISPDPATAGNTETTQVDFTVTSVSADGDTDTFTLLVPDEIASSTQLSDTINSVDVVDSSDSQIQVESGPTAVDFDDDGTTEGIQFSIAPNGGGTVDATATVSVDLNYNVAQGDYAFDAHAADSDGDTAGPTQVATVSVDEAPSLESATTADTDDNGQIDQVTVTFSEGVNDVQTDDYSIGSYTIESVSHTNGDAQAVFTVTESGTSDTGATPDVTYQSNGDGTETIDADEQGQEVSDGDSVTASDGAAPAVESIAADSTTSPDSVTVQFSEDLDAATVQDADFQVDKDTNGDGTYDTTMTISSTDTGTDASTVTINLDGDTVLDDANSVRASVVIGGSDDSVADESGNTAPTGVGTTGATATTGTIQ